MLTQLRVIGRLQELVDTVSCVFTNMFLVFAVECSVNKTLSSETETKMFPGKMHNSLSLHFNGHFPDGSGLAGTRMSPFWILLELRKW